MKTRSWKHILISLLISMCFLFVLSNFVHAQDIPKEWIGDTYKYRIISKSDSSIISNELDLQGDIYQGRTTYYLEDQSINKNNYQEKIEEYSNSFSQNFKFQALRSQDEQWWDAAITNDEAEAIIIEENNKQYYGLKFLIHCDGYNFQGKPDQNGNLYHYVQIKGSEKTWSSEDPLFDVNQWGLSLKSNEDIIGPSQKFISTDEFLYLKNITLTIQDINDLNEESQLIKNIINEIIENYNFEIRFNRDFNNIIDKLEWGIVEDYQVTYDPIKTKDLGSQNVVFRLKTDNCKIKNNKVSFEDEFYIVIQRNRIDSDPINTIKGIDRWSLVGFDNNTLGQSEYRFNYINLNLNLDIPQEENEITYIAEYLKNNIRTIGVYSHGGNDKQGPETQWYSTNYYIEDFLYTSEDKANLISDKQDNPTLESNQFIFKIESPDKIEYKGIDPDALYVIVTLTKPISKEELKAEGLIVEPNEPDNVTMNLFDYWNTANRGDSEEGNPWKNDDTPSLSSTAHNMGINTNHLLKFLYDSRTNQGNVTTDNTYRYGIWNHSTEMGHPNVTGLVENTLVEGYPKLLLNVASSDLWKNFAGNTLEDLYDSPITDNMRTESLNYLFDPTVDHAGKESYTDVSGLLQMNEQGYYYYDSKLNFAEFNEKYDEIGNSTGTGEFTLYNTWGVYPSGQSPNGQFFPFNTANDAYAGIKEDEQGNSYLIQDSSDSRDTKYNHHFGFTMEVDFQQPTSGVINHGSEQADDMVFKFAGDDDIWVYIDDVLVLDLGGLHSGLYGEINFSTGQITTGYMSLEEDSGARLGNSKNWSSGVTLKSLYEAAGKVDDTSWGTFPSKRQTFADGSVHTLKLFYMERGHWDSNFALYFNLQKPIDQEIYKVNEDGEPLGNATFSLSQAKKINDTSADSKFIPEDDENWYTEADFETVGDSIVTVNTNTQGSENDLGYAQLVKKLSDGTVQNIDFSTNYSNKQNIYILEEITSPDGYKKLNKKIILRYNASTNTFKVLNRYEVGAYGSFTAIIEDNTDQLYYATSTNASYNNRNELYIDKSPIDSAMFQQQYESISDEHQENALLFAVPMVYTDIGEGYDWYPVYGSNTYGYNVVNIYKEADYFKSDDSHIDNDPSKEYRYDENSKEGIQAAKRWALRHNLLAAALRQTADEKAPDWYFHCEEVSNTSGDNSKSSVRFTAELHNLPGDPSRYKVNNSKSSSDVDSADLRLVGLLVDSESLASLTGTDLNSLNQKSDVEKYDDLQFTLQTQNFSDYWDNTYLAGEKADWSELQKILDKAYVASFSQNNEGTRERGVNLAFIDSFTRTYSGVIYIPNESRELRVLKEDVDGTPLQGAEFGLFETAQDAQNGTKPIATGITDENGLITFKDYIDHNTEYPISTLELDYGKAQVNWNNYEDQKELWIREIKAPESKNGKPINYTINPSLIRVIVGENTIFADATGYTLQNDKLVPIDSLPTNITTENISEVQNSGKYNSDRVYVLASIGKLYKSMEKFADKILNPTLLDITTKDFISFNSSTFETSQESWIPSQNQLKYQHFWGDELNFNSSDYSENHIDSSANRNSTFSKTENGFIQEIAKQTDQEQFEKDHEGNNAILNSRRDDLSSIDFIKSGNLSDNLNGIFSAVNVIVVQDIYEQHKTEVSPGDNQLVSEEDIITYKIDWDYKEQNADQVIITDPLDIGVDFVEAYYNGVTLTLESESENEIYTEIDKDKGIIIQYDRTKHVVTWILDGSLEENLSNQVLLKVKVNSNAIISGSYTENENEFTSDSEAENDNLVLNRASVKVGENLGFTETVKNVVETDQTGSIKIEKKVIGEFDGKEEPETFSFTIKLYSEYDENDPGNNKLANISKTISGITFKNGVGQFELPKDIPLIIKNIPVGLYYVITEDENPKYPYQVEFEASNSGYITEDEAPVEIKVTNSVYGNLSILKVLEGEIPEDKKQNYQDGFKFTITLYSDEEYSNEANNINGDYGDLTFENGRAEFNLKNYETISALNLPAGLYYEITEDSAFEEIGTINSQFEKGLISANSTITAIFNNKVVNNGSLSITKKVEDLNGNESVDSDQSFEFELKLFDYQEDLVYEILNNDEEIKSTNLDYLQYDRENNSYHFKLKHNQTIVFPEIPEGTIYQVSEQENQNFISQVSSGKSVDQITSTETKEVVFTNTILSHETGSIEISKIVESDSNIDKDDFTFNLSLLGLDKETIESLEIKKKLNNSDELKSINPNEIYNETSKLFEFKLKNGEYILIKNIPINTSYYVIETDSGDYTSSIVLEDGYKTQFGQISIDNTDGEPSTKVRFKNTLESPEGDPLLVIRKTHEYNDDSDETINNISIPQEIDINSTDQINYHIYVRNIGTGSAHNINVIDSLPEFIKIKRLEEDEIKYEYDVTNITSNQKVEDAQLSINNVNNSETLVWNISELNPNDEIEIEFTVDITNPGINSYSWTNHALLTYNEINNEADIDTLPMPVLNNEYILNPDTISEFVWNEKEDLDAYYWNQRDHVDNLENLEIDLPSIRNNSHSDIIPGDVIKYSNDVYEYINNPEVINLGQLKVSKLVDSEDEHELEKSFEFELQLFGYNEDLNLQEQITSYDPMGVGIGDLEYKQETNKYYFTLRNQEQIVISGIPDGAVYQVNEVNSENYQVSVEGDSIGQITTDSVPEVIFTNTPKVGPNYGSLTISKKTGEGIELTKEFNFELVLITEQEDLEFTFTDLEKTNPIYNNGKYEFTLKDGEKLTVSNILEGTYYEVKEKNNADYIQTFSENSDSAYGLIVGEKALQVEFINNLPETGSLTIEKRVVENSNESQTQEFTFNLTLLNITSEQIKNDLIIDENNSNIEFDGNNIKFKLKDKQSFEINNIPLGTSYYLTEVESGEYIPNYNIEGYSSNIGVITKETSHVNVLVENEISETPGHPFVIIRKTHELVDKTNENISTNQKVNLGENQLTYNIYVKNVGDGEAHNINVIDSLPEFLKLHKDSDSKYSYSIKIVEENGNITDFEDQPEFQLDDQLNRAETLVWKIPSLKVNQEIRIQFTVDITDPGFDNFEWTNHALLTYDELSQEPEDYNVDSSNIINPNPSEFTQNDGNIDQLYWNTKDHVNNLDGIYSKEEDKSRLRASLINDQIDHNDHSSVIPGGIMKYSNDVKEYINIIPDELPETGELIVSKTVVGNDSDLEKEFSFKVTLSDTSINGIYGDMEFVNGVDNFTLKHGEKKIASNIPAGITYTVTESDNEGYEVISFGDTGSIVNNQISIANFINHREINGGLVVSKTVSGTDGDTEKEFTFTVTLNDTTIHGKYGEMEFTNGVANFTLKHGEFLTALNLPSGTAYTVTESDNTGYTVNSTGATGEIKLGELAKASFINHKDKEESPKPIIETEKLQSLNNGEPTREILEVKEGDLVTYSIKVTNKGEIIANNITITDTLQDDLEFVDDSISENGLFDRYNRTITWMISSIEPNESKIVTFTVRIPDIKGFKTWKNIAKADDEVSNEVVIVKPSENEYEYTGGLTISKLVIEDVFALGETNQANRITPFNFTVRLYSNKKLNEDSESITYPITFNNTGFSEDSITFNLIDSPEDKEDGSYYIYENTDKVILNNGYIAYITELPVGILYEVVEQDTNYYTLKTGDQGSIDPFYSYAIPEQASAHAAFVNYKSPTTKDTGSLIVQKLVDSKVFDENTEYEFTITLQNPTFTEPAYNFSDITFTRVENSEQYVGTVNIKHKKAKVIDGIPVGTTYTILESNSNGLISSWTSSKQNSVTGTITTSPSFELCTNTEVESNTEISIPVTKVVKGSPKNDSVFVFDLVDKNTNIVKENYTVPSNQIFTNGSETKSFGPITFSKEGIYKFEISERNLGDSNYTYDSTVYEITVNVTKLEDGSLKAEYSTEGSEEIIFTNIFEDKTITEVESSPNLEIKKDQSINEGFRTLDNQEVMIGDIVTYYLTVTNKGNAVAENIVVTDNIPDGLQLVEGSISDNGIERNRTITWNIDTLEAGETKTLSFSVIVPEVDKTTLWDNIATVKSDKTESKDSNEVTIYEPSEDEGTPSLLIEKDQSINNSSRTKTLQAVNGNDTVTYNVTVRNISNATATDVIIMDSIPEGLSLVEGSITDNGIEENGRITWNIGNLEPGESKTVSFTVRVPNVTESTTWTNIASTVYSNNPDGSDKDIPSNEVQIKTEVSDIKEIPNVNISKEQAGIDESYSEDYLKNNGIGDIISYRIKVENTSDIEATDVIIQDDIPLGTQLVDNSISDNGIRVGRTITWEIGTLKPHEVKYVSFMVTVVDINSRIRNTAHLTYKEDAPKNSNEVVSDITETPRDDTESPTNNPNNSGSSTTTNDPTNTPNGSSSTTTNSPTSSNGTYTTGTNTTTTNSNSFSTNAVTNVSTTSTTSPKTGVVTSLGLFVSLIGLSGAGLVLTNKKRRK